MKQTYRIFLYLILFQYSFLKAQTFDICVYGGTSAGVMAAYVAKKAGKSVILIEPGRHLGGLSAGGLGQTDIGNKYAITGIARDFYRKIGQHYGKFEQWTFEPHVAENLFRQYIKRGGVEVWYHYRIVSAKKTQETIQEIQIESGVTKQIKIVKAKMFIDCSYEGDLMAKAGVSYTVGREDNSQYNETWNGVQMLDKHQFPEGIDPYKIAGDASSGLLWGISSDALASRGSSDRKVQAYNFRLCLTNDPKNKIEIEQPSDYDPSKYELLLRQLDIEKPQNLNWGVMHIADMPNHKTDINNKGGFSTDMIGMNYDYIEADYATRQKIVKAHESYIKGFLYFIGHDPHIPQHLRSQMLQWGYPKDEYLDNGHFSHQMYVREARRMVGEYVMTQHNCEGREVIEDGIGLAAYTMDSHNCQRFIYKNPKTGRMEVRNEGDVQVGGFAPYPISYRALVPKYDECQNLIVPVCLSASHIAYGSIRMEPVFMALAQTSATAAVLAIESKTSIQKVDVKKLQDKLASNPLADGSLPEILLDNDITPEQVVMTGNWTKTTTGGKYAASLLYDESKGAEKKGVVYKPTIKKTGKYELYIFNPSIDGGGGNPGEVSNAGKSSKTILNLNLGKKVQKISIETKSHINDWIRVGEFGLKQYGENSIEISNQNADEIVVADAVLLIPKR